MCRTNVYDNSAVNSYLDSRETITSIHSSCVVSVGTDAASYKWGPDESNFALFQHIFGIFMKVMNYSLCAVN